MFTATLLKDPVLCDMCGTPRVSEVALGLVEPGVMDENCKWLGPHDEGGRLEKWKEALGKAEEHLQAECLQIDLDCESFQVCRPCLLKCIDLFSPPKTANYPTTHNPFRE